MNLKEVSSTVALATTFFGLNTATLAQDPDSIVLMIKSEAVPSYRISDKKFDHVMDQNGGLQTVLKTLNKIQSNKKYTLIFFDQDNLRAAVTKGELLENNSKFRSLVDKEALLILKNLREAYLRKNEKCAIYGTSEDTLFFTAASGVAISGILNSHTPNQNPPVPEPSTALVVFAGLAALKTAGFGRKRKS